MSLFPSGGDAPSAAPFVPSGRVPLEVLREAVLGCRGCDIYKCGTRAVLGEVGVLGEGGGGCGGCAFSRGGGGGVGGGGGGGGGGVMLVGEQPGDVEEREGRVFVGPAGKVLDRALAAAGIDRAKTYVTNAVKH